MDVRKIFLFCSIPMIFWSCAEKKARLPNTEAIPVKAIHAEATGLKKQFQYSGNIIPYRTVKFGFMVAGKVKAVYAEEGQYVKAGDLIAELEPTDYKLALDASQARFQEASKDFERLKKLYDKGSLTQSNLDKITALYTEARSDYEYKLKQYKDTRVYAPEDGWIAVEGVEPGEILPQGYPVFGLVYTQRVFAETFIPESEIGTVKMGMKVEVLVPALHDSLFAGTISRIGQIADAGSRAFPIKATLQNNSFILKPGMIAMLNIPSEEWTKQITIPANAVVTDANGDTYVFVVNNNIVSKTSINTGKTATNNIVVENGLKGGELIVVEGKEKLFEGAKVRLTN